VLAVVEEQSASVAAHSPSQCVVVVTPPPKPYCMEHRRNLPYLHLFPEPTE
jgi:hypothetical protein